MHYSNRAVTLIEQSLAYAPVIIQHEAVRCNQPLRNCSALYEGQPVCIYTCMYVMCKLHNCFLLADTAHMVQLKDGFHFWG